MIKCNLEIDENDVIERARDVLVAKMVQTISDEMLGDSRYSFLRRTYKENVQDEVRKLIKTREDEIINRAVAEASKMIARKALPKLIEKEL